MSPSSRPLTGVRVVVTRAEHQAGGLAAAFAAAGAAVETLPLLAVVPPEDPGPLARAAALATGGATGGAAGFDWIVFTSANAVDPFFDAAASAAAPPGGARLSSDPPARPSAGLRIAAVGPATAGAVRRRGAEPALVAGRRDAEGLAAELVARLGRAGRGRRVLLPLAADARPTLERALTAAGVPVTAVVAYDKRLPPEAGAEARRIFGADPAEPLGWVTLTSPRIVAHFAALFGERWPRRRSTLAAASIGAVTSRALRAAGVEPAAEAASPGDDELVAAVVAAVRRARG